MLKKFDFILSFHTNKLIDNEMEKFQKFSKKNIYMSNILHKILRYIL